MDTEALLVVLGDPGWTRRAMHLACAVARDLSMPVVVIDMVRVNHPSLSGETAGLLNHTPLERRLLQECGETAEDYAVNFELHEVAYADYVSGLASAAEQIGVSLVFAPPPASRFTFWNRLVLWRMQHAVHRPICTLESANGQSVILFESTPRAVQLDRTVPARSGDSALAGVGTGG